MKTAFSLNGKETFRHSEVSKETTFSLKENETFSHSERSEESKSVVTYWNFWILRYAPNDMLQQSLQSRM